MVAVQISSAEIVGLFRKGTKAPFTLPDLTACITSFIAAEGCPFLQGRALAASAEFTDVLPLEPCAEILQVGRLKLCFAIVVCVCRGWVMMDDDE